ncbi:elongation factor P 5-aminopentanone reductase [Cytobacillus sp. IB215665]|uniref:elongation factor P 5-aminopentanone reductase n=1 Tax=Cytobacillus sp. IB215665 TaxID=3097357 RepID=UPI002A16EFAE|nr:SDR family oxidoreductase [Cytobacillus sp. IB215665]MDX8365133.1 SDR family oxidoreductase [Cytobacillus sp. IB215665]
MKYALITGASGGIGMEIAKKLAEEGYSLYVHYHQRKLEIDKLINGIEQLGVHAIGIQADLSLSTGPNQLLEQIKHDIEIVIHNSGNSYFGLITDMDERDISAMVQLHVTSPFTITKALLPTMISNKRGNIVFITSIWGITGASCEVLYSMVKGGQNTFVKALAKEVAPSGIRVNGIAPGAINTAMLDIFSNEEIEGIEEEIPLGRVGTPQEIADTALFLISKKASYITGQILSVNGGWHC